MQDIRIRKVAVLGAGVMGAQIAAHCVNARVPALLFDLPDEQGGDRSATARRAIESPDVLDARIACGARWGAIFSYSARFQSRRSAIASITRSQSRSAARSSA